MALLCRLSAPVTRNTSLRTSRSSTRRLVTMSAVPTVHYFGGFRGRAETIKLALAAKGVSWELNPISGADMKSDLTKYKFAQAPRYSDDQVDMCQKNAILRHIARRWNLYGDGGLSQAAQVDEWLEGCEALRVAHFPLVYVDKCSEEAKEAFFDLRINPESASRTEGTKPRGAHFVYLDLMLKANKGGSGFCVGDQLTIADLELFELFDIFTRIFPSLPEVYPTLAAHSKRISEVPEVASYLKSPMRLEQVNGNGLG